MIFFSYGLCWMLLLLTRFFHGKLWRSESSMQVSEVIFMETAVGTIYVEKKGGWNQKG